MKASTPAVRLRPWEENDLPLLERLMGDPAVMAYLGGAETKAQTRARHDRYLKRRQTGSGCMFAILIDTGGTPDTPDTAVGFIGCWDKDWHGQTVWEMVWSVLPEFQGRGIGTRAIAAVVKYACAERRHQFMHALTVVNNGPSNAICRKSGFRLQGEYEMEYPPGHFMRWNDWSLDLLSVVTCMPVAADHSVS